VITAVDRPKINPMLPLLACITAVLSAWGLYVLMHEHGGMPPGLALLAIAGVDLFAVAAGLHGLQLSRDGDSSGPWNLAVVAIALLAAVLQFQASALEGHPWPVGLTMSLFPIATVALFEGSMRRLHRLQGRRDGRVAAPRASFELIQWLLFFGATRRAMRLAVADRTLGADGAFKLGLIAVQKKADQEPTVTVVRRTVDVPMDDLVPGLRGRTDHVTSRSMLTGRRTDRTEHAELTDGPADDADQTGATVTSLPSPRAAELLETARDLADEYRTDHGRPISRSAMAAAIRATGQSCPTDLAGELVHLVRRTG
jgi:hypothetical protein